MATEDRKRVGVPISGIDIAAPDHSVTDGKCETIHNLRYANGAWRNVHPFESKRVNTTSTDAIIERLYAFGRLKPTTTTSPDDDGAWGDDDGSRNDDAGWDDNGNWDDGNDYDYDDDGGWTDDRDDGYDMFNSSTPIIIPNDTELLFYNKNKGLNIGDTLYKIDKAGAIAKEWGQITKLTPYIGYDVDIYDDKYDTTLSYSKIFRAPNYDKKYTLYAWTDESGNVKFYTTTRDIWDSNKSIALYYADDETGAISKYLGVIDHVYDNPNKDDEYFNNVVAYKSAETNKIEYISDVANLAQYDINVTKLAYTSELGGDVLYSDWDGIKNGGYLYKKAYSGVISIGYISKLIAVDTLYKVEYTITATGAQSVFDYVLRLKNVYTDLYANNGQYSAIYKHPVLSANQYIYSGLNITRTNYKYAWFDPEDTFWYFDCEDLTIGQNIYEETDRFSIFGIITAIQNYTGVTATLTIRKVDSDETLQLPLQRADLDDIFDARERLIVALGELSNDGDVAISQVLFDLDSNREISINHFGKMLIVNDHLAKRMSYYLYDGEYYKYVDLDSINCKASTKLITQGTSPDMVAKYVKTETSLPPYYFQGDGVIAYEKICNENRSEWYFKDFDESENYWRGEFAIFFAMRTVDGSIVYKTAPQIVSSIPSTEDDTTATLRRFQLGLVNKDKNYYAYIAWPGKTDKLEETASPAEIEAYRRQYSSMYHRFYKASATLDYNIGESELVTEVAIYSTRLYSVLNRDITGGDKFVSKVDLLQEPYYLMDTIKIDPTKSNGSVVYSIGYKELKNIEQKVLYTPTISAYQLYSDNLLEYNNRLHMLGVTHKMPTINNSIKVDTAGAEALIVEWNRDSYNYSTRYNAKDGNKFALTQGILVTFPEKAKTIHFVNTSDNEGYYDVVGKLNMSYSALLDMSYYVGYTQSNWRKYQSINTEVIGETILVKPSTSYVEQPNRIQASAANNCLEYPYENSYRIGSNTSTIVAANAAAIEMSDAKFGEFPLYVFTNEGVFAMQSGGSNSLYSAVVPISYDKAINPNTLAVNYNVLFVTERGIMSLNNQGVSLISEGLNKQDNTIPEWMRTTEMLHAPQHNEVFATDKENKLLYVFSLDNKVWSTRDVEEGRILNNGELVTENKIINLLHETDVDELTEVAISTRPIKLGSMELKRLDTFILRFESASDQIISIQISGSTDTTNWIRFREVSVYTNRDIIIRRVPMSAKYIRINITGSVTDDIKILAMEMEYYLRMLRRMR